MASVKQVLLDFKEGLSQEVVGLKRLSGPKLEKFVEIFGIDEDVEIYFNEYNIVFTDPVAHDQLSGYLRLRDLLISLDCKEYNCHLWIYKYYNDNLFDSYLSED